MAPLTKTELQVLGVLEDRARLDVLQIASRAELPVSETKRALAALRRRGLVKVTNGASYGDRFALDDDALNAELNPA